MSNNSRSGKELSSILRFTLLGVGAAVCGLIGAASSRHFGTSSYTISFADFVAVMLSAVTLLITLLGFILAILAYFGWRELNERIDSKAGARTTEFLQEGFMEGGPLHKMFQTNAVARTTEFLEEGFREGGPLHELFHANAKRASYSGVDPILEKDDDSDGEQ